MSSKVCGKIEIVESNSYSNCNTISSLDNSVEKRAVAAKKMLDPDTYVQMAMAEIRANPNAFEPKIFYEILYGAICSAMSVFSRDGHLLYLSDDRKIKCLNCGKEWIKESDVPMSKTCNGGKFKK